MWAGSCGPCFLHALLQYWTCAQSLAHFLRQAKGRPHWMQVLVGSGAGTPP